MRLEKWKKNNVFEAIQKAGLRPEEFRWEQAGDDDRLNHLASSSQFVFAGGPGKYEPSYVAKEGAERTLPKYSWEGVMLSVNVWLADVKTYVETPDLWANLQGQSQVFGSGLLESTENTPFTRQEQAEIAKRLGEIKGYVAATYALSEESAVALETSLAYLQEAARRLGRVDWRNAAVGTVMAYLAAAALSPDTARSLFEMFVRTLGQLFIRDFPRLLSG